MDKLKLLMSHCKCGVYLTVNEHRDYYQSAEVKLEEYAVRECPPDISDETRAGIVKTDTIIDLQFYPDTPIGFYHVIHYDLDIALDLALACIGMDSVGGIP